MRWDYILFLLYLDHLSIVSIFLFFEPFGICNWFELNFFFVPVVPPLPLPWFFCVVLSLWTRMMMLAFQRSDHFPSLGMLLLSYVYLLSLIYTQSCSVVRGMIQFNLNISRRVITAIMVLLWHCVGIFECRHTLQCVVSTSSRRISSTLHIH